MFKHILIPTDGSDLSRKALLYGVELARESNAKVTALTIREPYTVTAVDTFTLVGSQEEFEMTSQEIADRALEHHQNQRDGEYRRPQNHQQRGCVVRPAEQRQPEPCHARAAHAMNGHNEVQAGEDGAESGDEDTHRPRDHVGIDIVSA